MSTPTTLEYLLTKIQSRKWEIWNTPLYKHWLENDIMSYQDIVNQDPMIDYYYKKADRLAKIMSYSQFYLTED